MAVYSGTAGQVTNNSDTTVAEVKEWSLDLGMAIPDVTAFGEEWNRVIPGLRNVTGSFSGNFDDTDTVQGAFKDLLLTGDTDIFNLKLFVSPTVLFRGRAKITGKTPSLSYDGAAQTSFSFVGESEFFFESS